MSYQPVEDMTRYSHAASAGPEVPADTIPAVFRAEERCHPCGISEVRGIVQYITVPIEGLRIQNACALAQRIDARKSPLLIRVIPRLRVIKSAFRIAPVKKSKLLDSDESLEIDH